MTAIYTETEPDTSVALPSPTTEIVDLLWGRIQSRLQPSENGCWVWTGHLTTTGYAQINHHGRAYLIHRVAVMARDGYLSADLTVDHLCRRRSCANPAHLEVVTLAENSRRGAAVARLVGGNGGRQRVGLRPGDTCPQGRHLLESAADIYVRPRTAYTECRHCRSEGHRNRRARASLRARTG